MPVRKINKSWWVDIRHHRARYRKKSPENSKSGAQAYEALLRQKLIRGEPIDINKSNQPTERFDEFAKKWYDVYVLNNNKPSEIRQKELILRKHLNPFFGKIPLDKITTRKIEEYKAVKSKAGKLALKSINNQLAILSKCLRTAQEWQVLEKSPQIKLFKLPPHKFDFLSQGESEQLLNSAQGIWREMIMMALKTGLRLGELTALDWGDVDLHKKIITVRRALVRNIMVSPKSNKIRHLPLTDELCLVLRRREKKKGFLFTDNNGQPFKAECARRTLHRICEKGGVKIVGWHTLRHTFASHLAEAGASMRAIQELLGHSDIKMTMRYAHLSSSTLHRTIKLLEPDANKNVGNIWAISPKTNLKFSLPMSQTIPQILANLSKKQDLVLN